MALPPSASHCETPRESGSHGSVGSGQGAKTCRGAPSASDSVAVTLAPASGPHCTSRPRRGSARRRPRTSARLSQRMQAPQRAGRVSAAPPPPPFSYYVDTPRPSPRTNRTRRVPHPVLIGRGRVGCRQAWLMEIPSMSTSAALRGPRSVPGGAMPNAGPSSFRDAAATRCCRGPPHFSASPGLL
jgi:hypothetical protein